MHKAESDDVRMKFFTIDLSTPVESGTQTTCIQIHTRREHGVFPFMHLDSPSLIRPPFIEPQGMQHHEPNPPHSDNKNICDKHITLRHKLTAYP